MKKLVFIASSLLAILSLKAQNIEVYKNGFAGLSPGWSSNYFSQTDVNGSKFLYQDWASGTVTNTDNRTYSTGYLFLFDKVAQALYVKTTNADSNIVLIIDKPQIATFTLNTDKSHLFISGKNFGLSNKNNFLEVLVNSDSAYKLLKLVTSKFVRADTHNMLNAINGNTKSSYVDDVSYFISYKNEALKKVNLSEKSFKSALTNKESKVESYISQNEKHTKNEQFYIELVQAANN